MIGVALNTAFVVTEVIYGLSANSLALISDAGHNLSDVMGLLLAWGAIRLSRTRPTARRTYGLRRSSILAALANAAMLLFVTGAITVEAVRRLWNPAPVVASTIMWVAAIGVLINGVTAALFASGRKSDINIRGAFAHMASDALIAFGVVVTGFAIRATGWLWLDPVASIAIGLVIAVGTWSLLRESVNLAMDAVPENVDSAAVESLLGSINGVSAVHDLHIWAMSTTETCLTAHLVAPAGLEDKTLAFARTELREHFGIGHSTIQVERSDEAPCEQADEGAV
jgi:cobalt-zinc-cadmium efflux system protein